MVLIFYVDFNPHKNGKVFFTRGPKHCFEKAIKSLPKENKIIKTVSARI
jgi:hypothetical protein